MRLDRIKDAYQKLKGSVYYDNSLGYIRTRIAEFEADNIDAKLSHLARSLTVSNWEEIRDRIIKSINVLTFPKQVNYVNDASEESMVISNVQTNKTIIDGYNNFIDMDIEGFLVGVLWVIYIGYKIDSDLNENCYANRLRDSLKLSSDHITASPNMFKPYYEQYESWRNKGLGIAQDYVNEHNTSVAIMTLDLTRYYYNVDFGIAKYQSLVDKYCDSSEARIISDIVFSIIQRYSDILGIGHNVLPIGFHPSNILANEYLRSFDLHMLELTDVIYYGRYVDDIMLIKKFDDNTELTERIKTNGPNCISELLINELCSKNVVTKEDDKYRLWEERYLYFQNRKFQFFFFDKNGSDDLIAKIKSDVRKSSSEFRFIPDDCGTLDLGVQKIERDDTVNKLRGIKKVTFDKFVLSKMISKNLLMSQFFDETQTAAFAKKLLNVLDGKELLNNYQLWERLLTYYVRNNHYDQIVDLSISIIAALADLDEDAGKNDCYEYLLNNSIMSVKESMVYYYGSCLARSLALVWGEQITYHIKAICELFEKTRYTFYKPSQLKRLRKWYVNSRMISKSVLPVCAELLIDSYDFSDTSNSYNLCSIEDLVKKGKKRRSKDYYYTPYLYTPFEIGFSKLIEDMMSGKGKLLPPHDYTQYVIDRYKSQFRAKSSFLDNAISCKDRIISIGQDKVNELSIAVSNVKMEENDIGDILDGKTIDRNARIKDVVALTNYAIKHDADVLVMPEAFVPYECLHILAKKSAKNQKLIVCGVEHILIKDYVWNLTCTLIPFECKGVHYSIPYFCQKEYFSPQELQVIKPPRVVPKTNHNCLFSWKNVKFATYCCYELTNIIKRSEYIGLIDIVFGVEWNRDVSYFSNIIESLSRDMYCFCIQSNMSVYGDSRIIQPTRSKYRDILKVKGGENSSVLIGSISVEKLHEARVAMQKIRKPDDSKNKEVQFAALPAGYTEMSAELTE